MLKLLTLSLANTCKICSVTQLVTYLTASLSVRLFNSNDPPSDSVYVHLVLVTNVVCTCILHIHKTFIFRSYIYPGKLSVDVIYMVLDELHKRGE